MEIAGNGTAARTGNPKIGAAGIENDLEFLSRRSDGNGAEVCIGSARDRCMSGARPYTAHSRSSQQERRGHDQDGWRYL